MTRFTRRSRSSYGRWFLSISLCVVFVLFLAYSLWQESQRRSQQITAQLSESQLNEWTLLEPVQVFCKADRGQSERFVLQLPKGQRMLEVARLIRRYFPASEASAVRDDDSDPTNRPDSYRVDCWREVSNAFFGSRRDFSIIVRYSLNPADTELFWLHSFWLDAPRSLIGKE